MVLSKDLSVEYDEIIALYKEHKGGDLSPVIEPAKAFLEQAKSERDIFHITKSYFLLGYIYAHTNDYGKAIIHYLEGSRNGESSDDPELNQTILSINKNLALILSDYKHYDLAHRFNNKALEIAEETDNQKEILEIIGINRIHYYLEEEKFELAIQEIDSIINNLDLDEKMLINLYNKKGIAFEHLDELNLAYTNFSKASIYDQNLNPEEYYHVLMNLAFIDTEWGNYDLALKNLNEARKVVPLFYKNQNKMYFLIERRTADVNFRLKNYAEAEKHFFTALDYIDKSDRSSDYFEIYKDLSEFYFLQNNLDKALEYKTLYSDHLALYLEQQKEIEELDKKYNIDLLTERYFDLLSVNQEKKAAVRTAQISLGSVILILLGIIFYMVYQKVRTKRDIKRKLLEIDFNSEV